MINTITIQGRLTNDPELRYVGSGKAVVKFSIANETGYGDKKKTSYPTFVAWEKKAEYIANYAKKGTMVVIQGTYGENAYTDKEGKSRRITEININEVFIPYDSKNVQEGGSFESGGVGGATSFSPKELDEGYKALEDDDVSF